MMQSSSNNHSGLLGSQLVGLWLIAGFTVALFNAGFAGFISFGLLLCLWITGGSYFWARFVSHTFSDLWYRYLLMLGYLISTFMGVSCLYSFLK